MKKLNILLINCDWRNMYGDSSAEFRDKLERDRLGGAVNTFFVFSWARVSYEKSEGNLSTRHQKTRLDAFRPLLDVVTLFVVPLFVRSRGLKFDAVVTYDFGFLPAAWLAAKLSGGKVVMCLNNQPRVYSKTRRFGAIKGAYSWLGELLWKWIPDTYFTINETMRSYIEALGIKRSKIEVFSMNTIERDREFITKAKQGVVRSKLGIPPESKLLLTVARLEAEKNYPKLLTLFAQLPSEHVLVCLGRGSLLESLKEQARTLGIQDRVFFEGFVHRDRIWDYYADADLFVLLSKAEALGVVLWEAMSMKVPVLVSSVEGMLETVGKDRERGCVWKEESGELGFVEKVAWCLAESPERSEMLSRAVSFVEERMKNDISINSLAIFKSSVQ